MGKGFIYNCPKCKHEETLHVGIGFTCPNPPEIETDIQKGLYGEKAKAFLGEHPEHWIDATLEVYQCRCGNIENKYHVLLKAPDVKTLVVKQQCIKCGSVMKMLEEPPEELSCPSCGSSLKLDIEEQILWD